MPAVPFDRVVELWLALAAGCLKDIEACDWRAGNGFVMTPDRQREIAEWQRAQDRSFYDSLGPERRDTPCSRTVSASGRPRRRPSHRSDRAKPGWVAARERIGIASSSPPRAGGDRAPKVGIR